MNPQLTESPQLTEIRTIGVDTERHERPIRKQLNEIRTVDVDPLTALSMSGRISFIRDKEQLWQ